MLYFDCHAKIGPRPFKHQRTRWSTDHLLEDLDLAEISGALAGAEDVLVALVEDQLVGGLLDNLAGDALGSFPIPDIDLSGMLPGLPPGTGISIDIQDLLRIVGYTVLTGDVK